MKRQTPSTRGQVLLFVVFCLFFTGILGCDKLDIFRPKKVEPKTGTSPISAVKGTMIAKVNNLPITLEELNRYVDIYNASIELREDLTADEKKSAEITTADQKLDYLKNILIRQRVFYQAALDRGLDRRDDIIEVLDRNKVAILAQEMQNDIIKDIDVGASEIEDAYKNNKNLFKESETRRIREIVTKTEDEAKQVLRDLLIDPTADFANIAKARSIADSAKNGGDLGLILKGQRGEQFAAFDEMAFSAALQQGAISSVFKGPSGYCVIKIEEVKAGKQYTLDEVKSTIKQLLLQRKQTEELDKIYSQIQTNTKIEIYKGEVK